VATLRPLMNRCATISRALKFCFSCRRADASLAVRIRSLWLGLSPGHPVTAYWFSPQNAGAFSPSSPHPR